ncbi:jg20146 [Pararge aegeria aegeria]|uniref:Jg20146 protein n=1 Tax=Pararge aegeria aegeria TaxID=348720 RepID=A0A8S4SEW3_9NEOP|nr:jg20146 [Pararge aegeria aegeria]
MIHRTVHRWPITPAALILLTLRAVKLYTLHTVPSPVHVHALAGARRARVRTVGVRRIIAAATSPAGAGRRRGARGCRGTFPRSSRTSPGRTPCGLCWSGRTALENAVTN